MSFNQSEGKKKVLCGFQPSCRHTYLWLWRVPPRRCTRICRDPWRECETGNLAPSFWGCVLVILYYCHYIELDFFWNCIWRDVGGGWSSAPTWHEAASRHVPIIISSQYYTTISHLTDSNCTTTVIPNWQPRSHIVVSRSATQIQTDTQQCLYCNPIFYQ